MSTVNADPEKGPGVPAWLSDSERSLIMDSIDDHVLYHGLDMKILWANRAAELSVNREPGSLVGEACWQVWHQRDTPCPGCPVVQALHTGEVRRAEITTPDGRAWLIRGYPIKTPDGLIKGVVEINQDITERKRAEAALRESEHMFRVLADTVPAAICILQDSRFKYINPAMEAISGYAGPNLSSLCFTDLVHPDVMGYVKGQYSNWKNGISDESRYELKGIDGSGQIRWADVSRKTISYKGKPAILLTGVDITDHKKFDEELLKAKVQAELYLDLMGHDINNMHQIALGCLELARTSYPDAGPKELLDKSIEVLQRSTQLIRNVRKLQKLHKGELQVSDVDVPQVLAEVQSEYRAVPGRTVTLNLNGHQHCYARANELLHDVFANLVGNAVKYAGEGAEIVVDLDRIEENGKQYCRVIVEDDGPGIPDDAKVTIFYRMGKSAVHGMGLGLYLVKSLVDSYGGKVWVGDRVMGDHTRGARFVVMLPAAENDPGTQRCSRP
ncbi:ATP-binding protein [Methanocella sp. MCL-LM]|uniref:ATP-binding protein n=1 Tax=Methanocella sp. MCL-LM TaxID=3412035 RepID=UPI003C78C68D